MRCLTLFLSILALSVPGAMAQKNNCQRFTGTIKATFIVAVLEWQGEAEVTIGKGQPMTGTTTTTGEKLIKGDPNDLTRPYSGLEKTTITLPDGKIVLETRFVVPPRLDPTLVWWVNETGSIQPAEGAEGKFAAIHGRVTIHGPFGPAVPMAVPPPEGVLGWIGEINGTICGVD